VSNVRPFPLTGSKAKILFLKNKMKIKVDSKRNNTDAVGEAEAGFSPSFFLAK
jgi:hypothetical protein